MDMKRYVYFVYYLVLVAIGNFCISCQDDSIDDGFVRDNPSEEEIVEVVLNKASIAWDSTKEQIQAHMSGYVLVDSDNNFMQYTDNKGKLNISYHFVDDCLQATAVIAPRLLDVDLSSYLKGYENLGDLSSKSVYYNTQDNTMCFSYDTASGDVEYSVIGFAPILSDLYEEDIKIKVDYKNLSYMVDNKSYKMILVDGGQLPEFYMMQTEVPLSGEFQIGNTHIGKIDTNGDGCIIKAELRKFITQLNDATGLEFRLPTEEEWVFAAVGGAQSQGYKYSGSDDIDDVAWYKGNCSELHDIATKQPNELGLYDMSGNYSEVCSDDPVGIDGSTYGGCWKYTAPDCTPTSWKSGNKSASKIPGTSIKELNAVDGRYITVRLVYSVP